MLVCMLLELKPHNMDQSHKAIGPYGLHTDQGQPVKGRPTLFARITLGKGGRLLNCFGKTLHTQKPYSSLSPSRSKQAAITPSPSRLGSDQSPSHSLDRLVLYVPIVC
ncbi:hypothetical protein HanIR_Chr04g0160281 [Helianthus annuus]|nr:hypothetical protein HanIR_Chr04g0160281 [Helianthus annuus]